MSNGGRWFNESTPARSITTRRAPAAPSPSGRPRVQIQGDPEGEQKGPAFHGFLRRPRRDDDAVDRLAHLHPHAAPSSPSASPSCRGTCATRCRSAAARWCSRSVIDPEQAQSRLDVHDLHDRAGTSGSWSRVTGYFAPSKSSYDLPEMKAFVAKAPGSDHRPGAARVRAAVVCDLQDAGRAQGDRGRDAGRALRQEAADRGGGDAQKNADEIMRPYVERTALKLPPTN